MQGGTHRKRTDLLYRLQKQKFDLVLHGHKHKPQFASIQLQAEDLAPYPLVVLAAGSTASDKGGCNNTLRLIETEPNGRLVIQTAENGELGAREPYHEPIELLK